MENREFEVVSLIEEIVSIARDFRSRRANATEITRGVFKNADGNECNLLH